MTPWVKEDTLSLRDSWLVVIGIIAALGFIIAYQADKKVEDLLDRFGRVESIRPDDLERVAK